jgi:hypothetical protein
VESIGPEAIHADWRVLAPVAQAGFLL